MEEQTAAAVIDEARIMGFIAARNAARKAKNFKRGRSHPRRACRMGIPLKDAKDPATGEIVTTWEVKR